MGRNDAEMHVLRNGSEDSFATLAFARNHVPGQETWGLFPVLLNMICEHLFEEEKALWWLTSTDFYRPRVLLLRENCCLWHTLREFWVDREYEEYILEYSPIETEVRDLGDYYALLSDSD